MRLLEARENASQSQINASVEIGIGLTTLQKAENGEMPKNINLKKAIDKYITKHSKDT